MHLHGDLIMEFANLIKGVFIGSVESELVSAVNDALKSDVAPALNQLVA